MKNEKLVRTPFGFEIHRRLFEFREDMLPAKGDDAATAKRKAEDLKRVEVSGFKQVGAGAACSPSLARDLTAAQLATYEADGLVEL